MLRDGSPDEEIAPEAAAWSRVLLGVILVVGTWLRLRAVAYGLSPEEVSDVEHGPLGYYLRGAEVGVNPPLLRVVLNVLFECTGTLIAGRILSLVCGVVAPLWFFGLARRASRGSEVAALFAALLAATLPIAVETGAEFRAYAPFTACAAALFYALARADQARTARERTGFTVALVFCAILLPQLHYVGVPLLVGLGAAMASDRRLRSMSWGLVASAFAFAPLAAVAVGERGSRVVGEGNVREGLLSVGSLDLSMPGKWVGWMIHLGWVGGWRDAERAGLLAFVVGSLLVVAGFGRRLAPIQKALLGAAIGVQVGVAIMALEHRVRSPVAVMLLVAYAPLLASLPSLVTARRRAVATALAFLPLLGGVVDKWSRGPEPDSRGALQWFAQHRRDFDAVRGDAPVWLVPGISHTTLHFYLVGHSWGPHLPATPCEGDKDCFVLDGVRYAARDAWPPAGTAALVVWMNEPTPGEAAGCMRVRDGLPAIWQCPAR